VLTVYNKLLQTHWCNTSVLSWGSGISEELMALLLLLWDSHIMCGAHLTGRLVLTAEKDSLLQLVTARNNHDCQPEPPCTLSSKDNEMSHVVTDIHQGTHLKNKVGAARPFVTYRSLLLCSVDWSRNKSAPNKGHGVEQVTSQKSLWNGDDVAQIFRRYKLLYK
jgi:hypothetical protein